MFDGSRPAPSANDLTVSDPLLLPPFQVPQILSGLTPPISGGGRGEGASSSGRDSVHVAKM